MKKLMLTLSFLSSALFIFAQSSELYISYNDISIKLDKEERQKFEVSDFSTIRLNIRTEQGLYIEDLKVNIKGNYLQLEDKIQLIEVNPSKNTSWKDYEIIFNIENGIKPVDIDLSIKNELIDKTIKLQFYLKKNHLEISSIWKTPTQANRENKTGIETILPKYVVNLEVNSSEPLLENDFKILLNDSYQKNNVFPRDIKSKAVIGNNGKTIYQYEYTCEIKLYEGINKVKLEITPKHYVPNQKKFYSSVLYLNKVIE